MMSVFIRTKLFNVLLYCAEVVISVMSLAQVRAADWLNGCMHDSSTQRALGSRQQIKNEARSFLIFIKSLSKQYFTAASVTKGGLIIGSLL